MRRLTVRRFAAILLAGGGLVALSIPRVGYAAAPDVRIVTPANIDIDGSNGDWDSQSKDFLAEMYKAGNPDKEILAKFFGRYDCDTETFYAHVVTVSNWTILPSDNDNYVKLGPSDKLVDGSDGTGGGPPDFAYIGVKAWEASFKLAPGSYLGDGGLNVHAEVQPENRADTAAVAGRRLDVIINCPKPTPTPEPTATPTPPPTPTVPPTAPPTEPPTPSASASEVPSASASEAPSGSEVPSASASEAPSASASEEPSGSEPPSASASVAPSESTATESEIPSEGSEPPASESAPATESAPPTESVAPTDSLAPTESSAVESEIPSGSEAPSGSVEPTESASPSGSTAPELTAPPLVVAKVDDKGTSTRDDDRLTGGAVFEVRIDDGDGAYEPDGDDGSVIADLVSPKGYSVYLPDGPGDYWVKEVQPPDGLETADAMLVKYRIPETPENCFVVDGKKRCQADTDNTSGYTVAVIIDSPIGAPPTEKRPEAPATDTDLVASGPAPSDDTLWVLFLVVGSAAGVAYLARTAPRRLS